MTPEKLHQLFLLIERAEELAGDIDAFLKADDTEYYYGESALIRAQKCAKALRQLKEKRK